MAKKAAYYICNKKEYGHVSYNVWDILEEEGYMNPTGIMFDGSEVMMHTDEEGNEFYFIPTRIAICLEYEKLLPEMNKYFADADIAGMVTWHEGASAMPQVLTVHTLGDMQSGVFGPIKPRYMRNLMLGIEKHRRELGLDDFKVVTEATHWSGAYGLDSDPNLLLEYPVPMMDIEVGSEPESWGNMVAARALALGLMDIFKDDGKKLYNFLCVGGVHFELNFSDAVFASWGEDEAFGITHILANQWLVSGEYENETGIERAENCIASIEGGVQGIVFHDKMKGCYKDMVRALGEKYKIPIYKHQRLRNPQDMTELKG